MPAFAYLPTLRNSFFFPLPLFLWTIGGYFPAFFVFAVSIPCFSVFSQKQNKLYKFRINCNFFPQRHHKTAVKRKSKGTKPPPAKYLRAAVGMRENTQKNCVLRSPACRKISSAVIRGGRKKQFYRRAKTTAPRYARPFALMRAPRGFS